MSLRPSPPGSGEAGSGELEGPGEGNGDRAALLDRLRARSYGALPPVARAAAERDRAPGARATARDRAAARDRAGDLTTSPGLSESSADEVPLLIHESLRRPPAAPVLARDLDEFEGVAPAPIEDRADAEPPARRQQPARSPQVRPERRVPAERSRQVPEAGPSAARPVRDDSAGRPVRDDSAVRPVMDDLDLAGLDFPALSSLLGVPRADVFADDPSDAFDGDDAEEWSATSAYRDVKRMPRMPLVPRPEGPHPAIPPARIRDLAEPAAGDPAFGAEAHPFADEDLEDDAEGLPPVGRIRRSGRLGRPGWPAGLAMAAMVLASGGAAAWVGAHPLGSPSPARAEARPVAPASATGATPSAGSTGPAGGASASASVPSAGSSAGPSGAAAASPAPAAKAGSVDWEPVVRQVLPSVVSVQVAKNGLTSQGSGVVLARTGEVLTNDHVLTEGHAAAGDVVQVALSDTMTYPAAIVGRDPSTDLAVLRITNPPAGLRPATFGDSDAVRVGAPVMVVGSPLGLGSTVTTGIISARDRVVATGVVATAGNNEVTPATGAGNGLTGALQTDAAVNPGNSGGALVDTAGRVIGIPSSILTFGNSGAGAGNIGLAFAIPANEARGVADQLTRNGFALHAWLGVTSATQVVPVGTGSTSAAVVTKVVTGSPAAAAGVRTGDAVMAVNGVSVTSKDALAARIINIRPGAKATFRVLRAGVASDVVVTLGTRPDDLQLKAS